MDAIKYRWEEITRGKKVFWGISIAVMLVVVIAMIVHSGTLAVAEVAKEERAKENWEFDNFVHGLASIPELQSGPDNPYIKGKVVVIDVQSGRLDPINDSLSSDLRAANKAETGTVVWLSWEQDYVGRYSTGGGAYVDTCRLTIIDLSIPAKIGVRTFRGPEPPSYVRSSRYGQSHSGGRPTSGVIEFLRNLPRR